jgi:hypothetical protein
MKEQEVAIPVEDRNQIERDFEEQLQPDYFVQVWRILPSNAAGYLDRISIGQGDSVAGILDEVIERFGGQSYKLKLCNQKGQYVSWMPFECRSYPPKLEGRELKRTPDPQPVPEQTAIVQRLEQPRHTFGDVDGISNIFEKMERLFDRMDQKHTETIKTIVETVAPKSALSLMSGVDEVLSFTSKISELKKAFGAAETAIQENPESNQLFGLLSNVVTQLFQSQPNPIQAGKGTLPTRTNAQPQQSRRQEPVQQQPKPRMTQQPTEEEARRFMQFLAAQPPQQIADVFWAFVDNMPDPKRDDILTRIDTRLSNERGVEFGDDEDPNDTDPETEQPEHREGVEGAFGPAENFK